MALVKAEFDIVKAQRTIPVYFNPAEYSITTAETGDGVNQKAFNHKDEMLTFTLYFDTYMGGDSLLGNIGNLSAIQDVRSLTEPIVTLTERETGVNTLVVFRYGSLHFTGRVVAVSQRFTMFMEDGRPVRAVLDITMRSADAAELLSVTQGLEQGDDVAHMVENTRSQKLPVANVRTLFKRGS